MQRALTSVCSSISLASNGQEAIEMVRLAYNKKEPEDVVLMDCVMPVGEIILATCCSC